MFMVSNSVTVINNLINVSELVILTVPALEGIAYN